MAQTPPQERAELVAEVTGGLVGLAVLTEWQTQAEAVGALLLGVAALTLAVTVVPVSSSCQFLVERRYLFLAV